MSNCIWCIGKNYLLHAHEMGHVPENEPTVFIKSMACKVASADVITLPAFSSHIDYETELAFLFDSTLNLSHITVALDLTARDAQSEAKKKGLPWSLAKSFKQSCPLGEWQPYSNRKSIKFSLYVSGVLRQKGASSDMLFSVEEIRQYLVERFPVQQGDIVLTGTPCGVSTVHSLDSAELFLEDTLVGHWSFQ